jgi:O-antigen/teichoic acid export membrane protein
VIFSFPGKAKSLQARIVSGSMILLSGSGLTTAVNLAYNIVIARYLGPSSFGQATVVYTLLTLLSAVTLSYQIVCAKIIAQQPSEEEKAEAYRRFHRSAWVCGLGMGLVLLLFRSGIANYLNLPDSTLVALLAIGAAFYIPLGCRRGYIQGIYLFRRFAINLVVEGICRLGGSYMLVLLGCGVRGVIAANAVAIVITYLAISPRLTRSGSSLLHQWRTVPEILQALFFFSGQVLINNCDIVLVKHLFSAEKAGLYSAVAMVGRVIFSFSSAIVNTTFPLVAGTQSEERRNPKVIGTSLALVCLIGTALALALWTTPPWVWTSLFGPEFRIAGEYDLSYLLALYALKTVIYSMSVVIITYEMSYKIANTNWIQLIFSVVLIEVIVSFHSSLREVILAQIALMCGLLICVALPFFLSFLYGTKQVLRQQCGGPIRLLRRVSEDEVIAEFLKSDFHRPEFEEYKQMLGDIVKRPNLLDSSENAKRRALLFTRHLSLWNEIPLGTEWYEVEINKHDISHIRAFPRAQWRRLARGNFAITEIAKSLYANQATLPEPFVSKIDAIGRRLAGAPVGFGAVILIGVTENEPLTVLDGNHRLVAALHTSPENIAKLRFMCGLSSRMTECCWYNTNFVTLFRYGKNVLVRAIRNSESDLSRILENVG